MNSLNPNQPFRTFEVSIDTSDPEQLLALQGLARAHNLNMRETTVVPQENQTLGQEEFAAEAVRLFGPEGEVYGDSMYNSLLQQKEDFTGKTSVHKGTVYWVQNNIDVRSFVGVLSSRPLPNSTPAKLEQFTRHKLEAIHPPFDIVTSLEMLGDTPPQSEPYVIHHKAGAITLARLADYATARHYPDHQLHGSIGKALSVLSRVAGLTPNQIEHDMPNQDYLSIDELTAQARIHLPAASSELLLTKIERILRDQIRFGKASEHGEVIIEGRFGWNYDNPAMEHLEFERIARSSLPKIAAHYVRQTRTTAFLRNLAQ